MMKQRKGMSLIEVVIAFALVSILIVMVSGAVTSTYQTSYKLQQLPTVYYAGQQAVENELAELDALIEEKYMIEKTIATQTQPDQDLINRLAAINAELVGPVGGVEGNRVREHYTLELFGKTVNVYRFELDEEIEGVGTVHFCAGTASGVRYERPVPLIDYVTVSDIMGGNPVYALYGAVGTTLRCSPTYIDDANLDYRAMNEDQDLDHYLWYTSPAYPDPSVAADMDEVQLKDIVDSQKLHCVYFTDQGHHVTGTIGSDDSIISGTMPVFPSNFDGIYETVKRVSSYTVTADDLGKFICCAVTPQSVNDAMGTTVVSNLVYLSALPVLTRADGSTKYKAVIDPSLMRLPEDTEDHIVTSGAGFSSFSSWLPGTNCTFSNTQGKGELHQEGSCTSEINDFKSRYIRVRCGGNEGVGVGNVISSNLAAESGDVIYMVVREHLQTRQSPTVINQSYIRAAAHSSGVVTTYSDLRGRLEEDDDYDFSYWRVIRTSGPTVTIGLGYYRLYGYYDLAELIIVNSPTAAEEAQIREYLGDKYRLN